MSNQITFDAITKQKYKINKPIRLIELFAGIGAQAKALENLGADFEHYRICEFDKYAVQSYNAIHGTDFTPSDITKLSGDDLGINNTDCFTYLLTYLLTRSLHSEKYDRNLESCRRVYSQAGVSPTVVTQQGGGQNIKIEITAEPLRIRKLTPRECFRLMSFSDDDFDKCKAAGISDCQLYKQAGNSIVVSVLEKILKELF